jgi:hypothetical protein
MHRGVRAINPEGGEWRIRTDSVWQNDHPAVAKYAEMFVPLGTREEATPYLPHLAA